MDMNLFDIPRLPEKEAQILGLLIARPSEMYGLEIVDASGGRVKRGTVYVTLNRMEEKGYISSRREYLHPEKQAIPRRLYKVTGFGARLFTAWEAAANHMAGASS